MATKKIELPAALDFAKAQELWGDEAGDVFIRVANAGGFGAVGRHVTLGLLGLEGEPRAAVEAVFQAAATPAKE